MGKVSGVKSLDDRSLKSANINNSNAVLETGEQQRHQKFLRTTSKGSIIQPSKQSVIRFKVNGISTEISTSTSLRVRFKQNSLSGNESSRGDASRPNKRARLMNNNNLTSQTTTRGKCQSLEKNLSKKEKDLKRKQQEDANLPYDRFILDEEDDFVQYDMDEEDAFWLEHINRKRKADRLLEVDPNTFEEMMLLLERESFFQYNGHNAASTIDEDAVCSICNDGECQNSNAILFCDICNLAVHQECYGVPYIPEGQWLCRRCLQSPSHAVDCVLCPNKGGAFKQTDDNRWAHVICAIWIPEVCFANTVFLEPIDSISAIPAARWKLICCVCHLKNAGACIQCNKQNCYVAFHVTCAQQAGFYMKIECLEDSKGRMPVVCKTAYCNNHAPVSKNGNGTIYSSGEDDESRTGESRKPSSNKTNDARQRINSSAPVISNPTIPIERLAKIAEIRNFPRRNDFLVHLYAYWNLKRQSRHGAPLLRAPKLQECTVLPSEFHKGKRDSNKVRKQNAKMLTLRYDLERVRILFEMVKKREKTKYSMVMSTKQTTEALLAPLRRLLFTIVDDIIDKDVNQFFLAPVDINDVPDYLDHIKEPMDLGTMRKKVDCFEYSNIDQFDYDLDLVISNCTYYNEQDTIWHKAALKLKAHIDKCRPEYRAQAAFLDPATGMHLPEHLPTPVWMDGVEKQKFDKSAENIIRMLDSIKALTMNTQTDSGQA